MKNTDHQKIKISFFWVYKLKSRTIEFPHHLRFPSVYIAALTPNKKPKQLANKFTTEIVIFLTIQ